MERLPPEVRAVLDAFGSGTLAAGQVSDALERAWVHAQVPGWRPRARYSEPRMALPSLGA